MKNFPSHALIFIFLILNSLSFASSDTEPKSGQNLITPDNLLLTEEELVELDIKARNGDCEAIHRIYGYYSFCTENEESALFYAYLHQQFDCKRSKTAINSFIEDLEQEYGNRQGMPLKELPVKKLTDPTAPSESAPATTPEGKEDPPSL